MLLEHLPVKNEYHPKRNQARQKLAVLHTTRFRELVLDVFFEIERRFPAAVEGSMLPQPVFVQLSQSSLLSPSSYLPQTLAASPMLPSPAMPMQSITLQNTQNADLMRALTSRVADVELQNKQKATKITELEHEKVMLD